MKKVSVFMAMIAMVLAVSCGDVATKESKTDSVVVPTDTAVVTPVVDSVQVAVVDSVAK